MNKLKLQTYKYHKIVWNVIRLPIALNEQTPLCHENGFFLAFQQPVSFSCAPSSLTLVAHSIFNPIERRRTASRLTRQRVDYRIVIEVPISIYPYQNNAIYRSRTLDSDSTIERKRNLRIRRLIFPWCSGRGGGGGGSACVTKRGIVRRGRTSSRIWYGFPLKLGGFTLGW